MSGETEIELEIPVSARRAIRNYCEEVYGEEVTPEAEIDGEVYPEQDHLSYETACAMREYADMDEEKLAVEEKLDRLLRRLELDPADAEETPDAMVNVASEERTRLAVTVPESVANGFEKAAEESDDPKGVALGRALLRYAEGGREARIVRKLELVEPGDGDVPPPFGEEVSGE